MPSRRCTTYVAGRCFERWMHTPAVSITRRSHGIVTCTRSVLGVRRIPHISPAVGNEATPPVTAHATATRWSCVFGAALSLNTPLPLLVNRPRAINPLIARSLMPNFRRRALVVTPCRSDNSPARRDSSTDCLPRREPREVSVRPPYPRRVTAFPIADRGVLCTATVHRTPRPSEGRSGTRVRNRW